MLSLGLIRSPRFYLRALSTLFTGNKMKLSRTVDYAVRATVHLAKSETESPIPCSQLANEGNMPERFLLQILRSLVNHGILRSTRGVDGGYVLLKKPDEISLLDVIEAIEGPMNTNQEVGDGMPDDLGSKFRQAIEQVTLTNRQLLQNIKISSLIPSPPADAGPASPEHVDPEDSPGPSS